MKGKKILSVFIIFSMLFAFSCCGKKDTKTDKFHVSAYIVADTVQELSALHSEDFSIITDAIIFGCATFDTEGKLTVNKEVLKKATENIKTAAKANEITLTLNILGPGGEEAKDWEAQMKNLSAAHNEAFLSGNLENEILNTVNEYGLDGIHFDYEYPISNKAWKIFSEFLVDLRAVMPDKIIGIAVSDWDAKIGKRAVEAIDYIELMLYDNYDEEGRHSTYEVSVKGAENKNLKHIPKEKAHFGLPFYARPTDRGAFWYGYNSYWDKLDDKGFYKDEKENKTFWFNTPEVIKQKTKYAIENNYGGVMIWHYACDLPSSDSHSLLKAIDDTILNRQ